MNISSAWVTNSPSTGQSSPLIHKARFLYPFLIMLAVSAVLGWVVVSNHYTFGTGDQVEQLPLVLRLSNPSFLTNDFYLNAAQGYGSRFTYSFMLSFLSRAVSMTRLYFLITLLTNILLCFVTMLTTRKMFGNSTLSALLSGVLFFSFSLQFSIGGNLPILYIPNLIARAPAILLLEAAFLFNLYEKPFLSALMAGIASLIHPQIGLIAGWIFLFSAAAAELFVRWHSRPGVKIFFKYIPPALTMVAFSLIYFLPTLGKPTFDDQVFFDIYARFRVPHHLLPSTWLLDSYIEFLVILAAFLLALLFYWRSASAVSTVRVFPAITAGAILLSCLVIGYGLTDVYPTRIGASVQAFRFLVFVYWLLVILIAGWAGCLFEANELDKALRGYLILLSSLYPITLLISTTTGSIRQNNGEHDGISHLNVHIPKAGLLIELSLVIGLLFFYNVSIWPFILGLCMVIAFYRSNPRQFTARFVGLLLVIALAGISPGYIRYPEKISATLVKLIHPAITLNESYPVEMVHLGNRIKENTPADAVILTPPNMGVVRLLADRSIVVDFMSMVFQEPGLLDWYSRLVDCYGQTKSSGFEARDEMNRNYGKITDDDLTRLSSKYSFSYALLFSYTKSDFPVVLAQGKYKLVSLAGN